MNSSKPKIRNSVNNNLNGEHFYQNSDSIKNNINSAAHHAKSKRAPLAPIPVKQNGQNKGNKLPYNAPRTRSQSRGKITLKQIHQNNRANAQPTNPSYASKATGERSTFQSVPQYVQKQRHDSGIYSECVPSSYDTNMNVSSNSINNSHNMQVDDSSLTTHFHDLHNVSVSSKDADFPMYDESEKMCSTPILPKENSLISKELAEKFSQVLDYKFYSKEEAYKADWDLSDDIHENNYKSFKNNGIKQYKDFHEEYQHSYYNNMLKCEKMYSANPRYMIMQENYRQERMVRNRNINGMNQQNHRAPSYQMRVKVVDWLLELQDHFRMVSSETFHLSVSYIDRYLSAREVKESEMQEVAVTATFLASKFVDYQSPSLRELSEITAHSVSKRKILDRERHMLKTFTCTLCTPTTYHFLIEIISSQGLTRPEFRQVRRVALYFCDISRLAYDLLIFPNRVLAIACLFLSFSSCGLKFRLNSRDNPILYMNVKTNELVECIGGLVEIHLKSLAGRFEDARFEDGRFEDKSSNSTAQGNTTNSQIAAVPLNAFRNLYANKRWATTLSTFQKDHENYGIRGSFKNWHMTVKANLEELIKSW